jgi:hypothetical protein
MHLSVIPSSHSQIQTEREARLSSFTASAAALTDWLTTEASDLALHNVVATLTAQMNQLALAALALWSALRLDDDVPSSIAYGTASYSFRAWRTEMIGTRFGKFESVQPVYVRHQGSGPKRLLPHGRRIGLAPGRMSLGVQLQVANLVARMPFQAVQEVADVVGLWIPGQRAVLGIVDAVGDHATAAMLAPPAPVPLTEGTHVVIEQDDGGIPHVSPKELEQRRRPNRRKTRGRQSRRARRRTRRGRRCTRQRRRTGDKSKNCRMATVYVVYTLQVHADGTVEGPLNRQVFASTCDKAGLRTAVLRAAKARGWGTKPSLYLADGAATHWKGWKEIFHEGTPCIDWYHVAEYLWQAADAVFRVSRPAPRGKTPLKHFKAEKRLVAADRSAWVRARQDELLAGDIDAVERHIAALAKRIGRSGPGTRSRRSKVQGAATYIQNHCAFLTYSKVKDIVMGTGVVESTIKQLGARMKGAGMRWSVERGQNVLALRCLLLSDGGWDRFAVRVREAHEATTSLHVRAISPTRIVTAHNAVRKAL